MNNILKAHYCWNNAFNADRTDKLTISLELIFPTFSVKIDSLEMVHLTSLLNLGIVYEEVCLLVKYSFIKIPAVVYHSSFHSMKTFHLILPTNKTPTIMYLLYMCFFYVWSNENYFPTLRVS